MLPFPGSHIILVYFPIDTSVVPPNARTSRGMDFPVDVFCKAIIAQYDPHTLVGWKVGIDFHPTGKSVGCFRPRLTQLDIV